MKFHNIEPEKDISDEKQSLVQKNPGRQSGFNPTFYKSAKITSGVIDLEPDYISYTKKVAPLLDNCKGLKTAQIHSCFQYFTEKSLPSELRKELWSSRIGNRLKLTKNRVLFLKKRLEIDGVDPVADKVISNDLNRTFPDCKTYKQGREMYEAMQRILRMFQLYRPDIGYVQGMSYLVSALYYIFEEEECFILFCNLIICNKFIYSLYTFDVNKVSFTQP